MAGRWWFYLLFGCVGKAYGKYSLEHRRIGNKLWVSFWFGWPSDTWLVRGRWWNVLLLWKRPEMYRNLKHRRRNVLFWWKWKNDAKCWNHSRWCMVSIRNWWKARMDDHRFEWWLEADRWWLVLCKRSKHIEGAVVDSWKCNLLSGWRWQDVGEWRMLVRGHYWRRQSCISFRLRRSVDNWLVSDK